MTLAASEVQRVHDIHRTNDRKRTLLTECRSPECTTVFFAVPWEIHCPQCEGHYDAVAKQVAYRHTPQYRAAKAGGRASAKARAEKKAQAC